MPSIFEKLTTVSADTANNWSPLSDGNLPARLEPHTPYELAASIVEREILERDTQFSAMPTSIGTQVQFRFIHIAAQTARNQGVRFDELSDALRHPKTYEHGLGVAASNTMDIAYLLEMAMGIRLELGYKEHDTLPYKVSDHVEVTELPQKLKEIKYDMEAAKKEIPTGACPAHLHLPKIFQSMVSIALNDPLLIKRTLEDPTTATG